MEEKACDRGEGGGRVAYERLSRGEKVTSDAITPQPSPRRRGAQKVSYLSSFLVLDFITNEFCAQPCKKMTVPFLFLVVGADDDNISSYHDAVVAVGGRSAE